MKNTDILKAEGTNSSEQLDKVILKAWKEEKMPDEWMARIYYNIHIQKGDKGV